MNTTSTTIDTSVSLDLIDFTLVLFQHYNYGFSVPVLFRNKAQCEAQGPKLAT
jgi:hypothetical protein